MGVVGTVVHVHVLDETTAKTVLGEHTLNNLGEQGVVAGLNVLVERLLHEDLGSGNTLSAGIAGVREVLAVGPLLAGEAHLVGVDYDNVVTTLHVGRVAGLVFATENECDCGAETTENLVGGIDYNPLVLNLLCVGREGLVA